MSSIKNIVTRNLCVSCGACRPVCPHQAISFLKNDGLFVPNVDNDSCVDCGICTMVCPSFYVDATRSYNSFKYDSITCYTAFSNNDDILSQATSGGVVTTMVSHLLSTGLYDYAYLLEYETNVGWATLRKYKSEDELGNTTKSKYIPASVESIITEIREKRISKAIVVCTPCQMLAISRALTLYKVSRNSLLFIGLFCDNTLNYNVYKYFEYRYGHYSTFHFRDKTSGGWPGNMLMRVGDKVICPNRLERIAIKPYFQLNRCRYCFDKLNVLADLSVGDCYIYGEESSKGKSSVIIRTDIGRQAFLECKGCFSIKESSIEEISKSQFVEKKQRNIARNLTGRGAYTNVSSFIVGQPSFSKDEDMISYQNLLRGSSMTTRLKYEMLRMRIAVSPKIQRFHRILSKVGKLFYCPDKSYYVYIDNDGYDNRGDQLMIDSIAKDVLLHRPDASIVVSPITYSRWQTHCSENNYLPLQNNHHSIILWFYRFIHKNVIGNTYVTPKQIDLVLNAKGYAYGDKWNKPSWIISADKKFYSSFKKKGRKLFLLPQAFGPYGTEVSREQIKQLYKMADMIFPREETSYSYVAEVVSDTSKMKIVPDFTISAIPYRSCVQFPKKSYITIIPNARMIDKTSNDVSVNYLSLLYKIINMLQGMGENVIFLNHEGEGDANLMDKLNNMLQSPITIVTDIDGMDVKAIIRDSKLVISSRYHGVVSGLTQGVPTICTSWSHKYLELLKEHDCEDSLLNVMDVEGSLEKIRMALDEPERYSSKSGRTNEISSKVEEMWQVIFQ